MDKKSKVSEILMRIKEQCEELLDEYGTEEMSEQEIIVLATEITLSMPVTTIEYTQPMGVVDKSKVTFMLDDQFEFPLFGEEYYREDDV